MRDIVHQARDAFLAEMARRRRAARTRIDVFEVPGAFEIPLHAQSARAHRAATRRSSAAAFVVDGGIYRHEFVADDGGRRADAGAARDRRAGAVGGADAAATSTSTRSTGSFFREHFVVKGTEAAQACLKTVESLRRLAA